MKSPFPTDLPLHATKLVLPYSGLPDSVPTDLVPDDAMAFLRCFSLYFLDKDLGITFTDETKPNVVLWRHKHKGGWNPKLVEEFKNRDFQMSILRMGMIARILIEMQADHSQIVTPTRLGPKGRVFVPSTHRDKYSFHLIDIRPTPKRVSTDADLQEYVEDLEKNHKRYHAVRGHIRRLASGRCVWVRPHMRGRQELGFSDHAHHLES